MGEPVAAMLRRKLALEQKRYKARYRRRLAAFAVCVGGLAAALALLFTLVLGIDWVQGDSMQPALCHGDLVVYNRLARGYAAGDVVVFRHEGGDVLKRVAAAEGDTVVLDEIGQVLVNSQPWPGQVSYVEDPLKTPLTVPPGSLFVLGDNPAQSLDSRSAAMGLVPQSVVQGRVLLVLRLL